MTQKAYLAECNVIGSMLISLEALESVIGELLEDDFYDHFLRHVFTTIVEMKRRDSNQVIDILTVSDAMSPKNSQSNNENFCKLAEIANNTCSAVNVKAYAEIVKRESNKRKTMNLLNTITHKIGNGDEDYLDSLRHGITKIENNVPFIVRPYADILNQVVAKLDEDSKAGKELTGISTGFSDIDFYTNGLHNGDLIILAARPSMGKTMLMLNIADNISCLKQNEPVVMFSLEMPESQICKRSLARVSGVKGDLIFTGRVKGDDWQKIGAGIEKLNNSKLFINDSSRMSVYQMRSFCRKIRNEHGLKVVFIDYIGLMDGEGENETLRLGNISRDLKAMAKDFEIPVFVLCQLNRNIEKRLDRTPMLSDIRQSGNIEQDADLIMFLDTDKEKGESNLSIAKHRNGRTGDIKLSLFMDYFEFKNHSGFSK